MITQVRSDEAPPPAGHYSQAIRHNGMIFVSGQLPHLSDGTVDVDASFEEQSRRVLSHILAIVRAAGGDCETILRVTVYITDVANWPVFNRIYAELLGEARPARTVVPVPALHFGYQLEIEAIAASR